MLTKSVPSEKQRKCWEAPIFHNSFRISFHIVQMAFLWSYFTVRPPRPPPKGFRDTNPWASAVLSPPPGPTHPEPLNYPQIQPSSLKNNNQSTSFIISHARRDSSWEPGSWEVFECLESRNSSLCKQEHKEPAERTPRFYGD